MQEKIRIITTRNGTLVCAPREVLFQRLVDLMDRAGSEGRAYSVGLTGGSTPKAFYDWAVREDALPAGVRERAVWTVSDERMVPLTSEESNFGTADRRLLKPLNIPEPHKLPWPVEVDPHSAATVFNRRWTERFGGETCFDLCVLGMGDDGHTASIFPGSPLLEVDLAENFTCVEVPGKGWRLSITRAGLERSRKVAVVVTGAAKANVLKEVMDGPENRYPVQILQALRERVTWLVDPEAAAGLKL